MKKILKNFFPALLIIILSLSYSFSQDDTDMDLADESKSEEVKKDNTDNAKSEEKSDSKDQPEVDNDSETDEVEKKVEPVVNEKKKIIKRKPVRKKNIAKKEGVASPLQIDNGLLRISPDDTIFKRIPEIKLNNNKKPFKVEEIVRIPDTLGETDESSKNASGSDGLFGFSKEKTEVIAQVSIVLLILLVFILYKARSRGPIRRS